MQYIFSQFILDNCFVGQGPLHHPLSIWHFSWRIDRSCWVLNVNTLKIYKSSWFLDIFSPHLKRQRNIVNWLKGNPSKHWSIFNFQRHFEVQFSVCLKHVWNAMRWDGIEEWDLDRLKAFLTSSHSFTGS